MGEDADEQAEENWKAIKTIFFPKDIIGQTTIEHIQGDFQKENEWSLDLRISTT